MSNEKTLRYGLADKKRIVIKVGSSTIMHEETGDTNLLWMERLVRFITDLRGQGKDVILVTSGAVAAGRKAMHFNGRPQRISEKQALAAIGQARLMMIYQRMFAEYSQTAAQVLVTKNIFLNEDSLRNTKNTFNELLQMGVVPIVNENDTISTSEISFGDNDRLSALVATICEADLLILLSDIDGLYTDDPHSNPLAGFISYVPKMDEKLLNMGKSTSASDIGTGGMRSKIEAARIATDSGADMVIMSGEKVSDISALLQGDNIGTIFAAHKHVDFDLMTYIRDEYDKN
ncbi:MAG: glutamate 5-kinase [Eubacteriales bacterium]|nr:glutamate 5-kinase [Eubacteriales bacterium]